MYDGKLRYVWMELDELWCLALLVDKYLVREFVSCLALGESLCLLTHHVITNETVFPLLIAWIVGVTLFRLLLATSYKIEGLWVNPQLKLMWKIV